MVRPNYSSDLSGENNNIYYGPCAMKFVQNRQAHCPPASNGGAHGDPMHELHYTYYYNIRVYIYIHVALVYTARLSGKT